MGYVFVVCFWYVLELKCDSTVLTPTLVTQAMSSFLICPKYRCFQQRLNHDRQFGLRTSRERHWPFFLNAGCQWENCAATVFA